MATMTMTLKTYEPDGITERETYPETVGIIGDDEMTVRNLTFTVTYHGCASFSFMLFKEFSMITTVAGDIVKIEDDSSNVRFIGKIDFVTPDYSDTDEVYEDKVFVSGFGILLQADKRAYNLRESNGGAVSTNLQELLDDVFQGGEYSGKGQDNNQPLETSITGLNYVPANNVLPALDINVSYLETSAGVVVKDVYRLANGTFDLTSVQPKIYWFDVDGEFYTATRSTSNLFTFDVDDGDFPVRNSDDLSSNGYRRLDDNFDIFNKFILNGEEITTLQYSSEVTASRTKWGTIHAPELENKNITIIEGQKWLDGFILKMLDTLSAYEITLSKETYGRAPIWFFGSGATPNGNIKMTEGGAGELFAENFLSCTYTFDSGGWSHTIRCGSIRPDITTRSEILTKYTGLGTYPVPNLEFSDPSDTADEDTLQGHEFYDYGGFYLKWDNPDISISASDVTFEIKDVGRAPWPIGVPVKTLTSATNPKVIEDSSESGMFRCFWFRGTSGTRSVGGDTIYPIGLTSDRQYEVYALISLNLDGVPHILKTTEKPFFLATETTATKAKDSKARMPDAETENTVVYDPGGGDVTAKVKFFATSAPDSGSEGWFITDDSITWVRITGDFAGNLTGTTNNDFTINADQSTGQYITLTFDTDTGGTDVGIIRYDQTNTKIEMSVNDGISWTEIATGVNDAIQKTVSATTYKLRVDASTGDLIFNDGSNDLFKVSTAGDLTVYSDILPDADDSYALGAQDKKFANAYIGNVVYTQEVTFSDDGGATENGQIEWDAVNGQLIPHNFAIGFMDA